MKRPEDLGDGTLVIASFGMPYTEKQWKKIKGLLKRRKWGVRVMYVSDELGTYRRDPVSVAQFILGIPVAAGIVLVFLALIVLCILPWVMA